LSPRIVGAPAISLTTLHRLATLDGSCASGEGSATVVSATGTSDGCQPEPRTFRISAGAAAVFVAQWAATVGRSVRRASGRSPRAGCQCDTRLSQRGADLAALKVQASGLDLSGRLVAINSAIFSQSGIGHRRAGSWQPRRGEGPARGAGADA
jgi:hypothetical protein